MSTYEAVVGDEAKGLLLRLAVDGAEGCWETTRAQTVDIGFLFALLHSFDNGHSGEKLFV